MGDTKFSFAWNTYQKNICSGLSFLQQKGEFVDMTIAADGHLVRVHQMVMSLVSPYIKKLITSAECPKPVIFLNNVSYETLQFILEYAYTGEVLVPRQRLEQFLQVCNALQIKGLDEMSKNIIEIKKNDLLCQVQETNKSIENNTVASIDLSHSVEAGGEVCAGEDDFDDIISDHVSPTAPKDSRKENLVYSIPKIDPKKCKLQYSVSAQGSPQLILNRYIYLCRSAPHEKSKSWRCYSYNKGCVAAVFTKGGRVVHRSGTHNHGFHDAQILSLVRNKSVFTVEPKKRDSVAKSPRSLLDSVAKSPRCVLPDPLA